MQKFLVPICQFSDEFQGIIIYVLLGYTASIEQVWTTHFNCCWYELIERKWIVLQNFHIVEKNGRTTYHKL